MYARENGLLTRDHEFSSGYSGVSTCGDSDGLRARAPRRLSSPRRALRREGRGKDRFAGAARSLAPFHFCDDCYKDNRGARKNGPPKNRLRKSRRSDTDAPKLVLGTSHAKCQREGIYLSRAVPTIGAMWTYHESVVIQRGSRLLNINCNRTSVMTDRGDEFEWSNID